MESPKPVSACAGLLLNEEICQTHIQFSLFLENLTDCQILLWNNVFLDLVVWVEIEMVVFVKLGVWSVALCMRFKIEFGSVSRRPFLSIFH